jgi:alpha-1,2-mannosyltransferase
MSKYNSRFKWLFLVFLSVNFIGCYLNHIDDTDETYGYWEPLHYLTFGKGMQTWEYAPKFAIRTYAYIIALLPYTKICHFLGMSKYEIFYAVRMLLATITAYSQTTFILAINDAFGLALMRLCTIFLLFSPGVFLASTAFLPSASAMNCVMLGFAAYYQKDYVKTILFGCIAVLCTGWPFVGVVFLAPGLHMLYDTYTTSKPNERISNTIGFLFNVFCAIIIIGGSASCVDRFFYGRWTFPTWNILVYNAGGNGDNLYGVEPSSYYTRNLLLTLGIAWPLGVTAPLLLLREYNEGKRFRANNSIRINSFIQKVVSSLSASLWLALLYSRPHKEDRFMYPIYPLMALTAAYTFVTVLDMIGDIVARSTGNPRPLSLQLDFLEISRIDDITADGTMEEKAERLQEAFKKRKTTPYKVKNFLLIVCLCVCVLLSFIRILSLQENFSGYLNLWSDVTPEINKIIFPVDDATINEYTENKHKQHTQSNNVPDVTICLGGEWYRFASHFHLPDHANLAFVKDTFMAQLPQYYPAPLKGSSGLYAIQSGTSSDATSSTMNGENKLEDSRFVDIQKCDYVVSSLDKTNADPRGLSPMLRKMTILYSKEARHKYVDEDMDLEYFEPIVHYRVLDRSRSFNSLARAFFIPGYSNFHNEKMHYSLYKRVHQNDL